MRHNVVSSEITGRGYRFPNVPAQMTEDSASFVKDETKMSRQEMIICSAMERNLHGEKTGVSRGHSSRMPGVMSRIW